MDSLLDLPSVNVAETSNQHQKITRIYEQVQSRDIEPPHLRLRSKGLDKAETDDGMKSNHPSEDLIDLTSHASMPLASTSHAFNGNDIEEMTHGLEDEDTPQPLSPEIESAELEPANVTGAVELFGKLFYTLIHAAGLYQNFLSLEMKEKTVRELAAALGGQSPFQDPPSS